MDVLSLIATVVLTVAIYWLQRSHEKEREQMETEAQKKAVAEAARVFLIDNEDEIEYLPLSAIAKTLKLKRKHHRAITTKFLRCSEEVQKEILKQANFQPIEVSPKQVSVALKRLKMILRRTVLDKIFYMMGLNTFIGRWSVIRMKKLKP